jgi:glycerophosphoryl diester phosphodiesterase
VASYHRRCRRMAERASTLIIAHRGGVADAREKVAENTLEAFAAAIRDGADGIELDVRRNRDDELVVFHDDTVRGIPFGETTRDQVARVTGISPPLLEEALEVIRGQATLDLELKEGGYVHRVMRMLVGFEPEQLLVTSFLDYVVLAAKQDSPGVKTGLLLGRKRPQFPVSRLRSCRADYAVPNATLARWGVLSRASSAGYPALVWTVNDHRELERYLRDERVRGIITDVPRRALEVRGR